MPGQANYCAAKAGLLGLTKSAARELGSRGITVNAIAPGFIETEMTEGLSEELRAKMQERIPLGHMGTAENVADAAAFLASDQASYITGQVLSVGRRYVYVDRKAENMRRVVITGMGAITPLGNSVEAFWNGIKEKKQASGLSQNLTHRRINADWRRK